MYRNSIGYPKKTLPMLLAVAALSLIAVAIPSMSLADDAATPQQNDAITPPQLGELSGDGTKTQFTISPRVWWSNRNPNEYNGTSGQMVSQESISSITYGLTLGVSPVNLPKWDFFVTGLYGSTDFASPYSPAFKYLTTSYGVVNGTLSESRMDLELLSRYKFEDLPVYGLLGVRYIHEEETKTLQSGYVWTATGTRDYLTETNAYLGEVGALAVMPFSAESHHAITGHLMGALGYGTESNPGTDPDYSGLAIGWEMGAGYIYKFSDAGSVIARYRATFIPQADSYGGISGYDVIHGPEISASLKF